jgi:hypothetical protein
MRTDEQKNVAMQLLVTRPTVLPGITAIPDPGECGDYDQHVIAAAKEAQLAHGDRREFYDLCGIPDSTSGVASHQ